MKLKFLMVLFVVGFQLNLFANEEAFRIERTEWEKGYTMMVLESSDIASTHAAQEYVESLGGKIAIVIPPRIMFGWIPENLRNTIQGQHGISFVTDQQVNPNSFASQGEDMQLAANIFNYVVSGKVQEDRKKEESMQREPISGDALQWDSFDLSGKSLTFLSGNSDSMTGTVSVALFLVESNGAIDPNTYTWTPADQTTAVNQVVSGLSWWSAQAPTYSSNVTFYLHLYSSTNPVSQQPYEPILHSSTQSSLWVNAITSNLGYSSLEAFNSNMRSLYNTNWAFSAFIGYNPPPAPYSFNDGKHAFAFFGGPYTQLLFQGIGYDGSTMTHETGHIFWACDEYYAPGYGGCTSCGACNPNGPRPTAQNGNCEFCNTAAVSCVMRNSRHTLCDHTPQQIGWGALVETELANAVPRNDSITGSTPNSTWKYYFVDVDFFEALSVELYNLTADADLYVAFDRKPTRFDSDCSSGRSGTTVERCIISAPQVGRYWIGVNNYSTGTINYTIAATMKQCANTLIVDPLPISNVNVNSYVSQNITATNGTDPYQYEIFFGRQPDGLSLYLNGWLTGYPTTAGTFQFGVKVTDRYGCTGAGFFNMTVSAQTAGFNDEFDDNVSRTDVQYLKGTWNEIGGSLIGSASGKALMIGSPAFAGCANCTLETTIMTGGGRVWVFGWYQTPTTYVELMMNPDTDKWSLKQYSNGVLVAKQKATRTISSNTAYKVRMVFDGTNFKVYIDDVLVITMTAGASPFGTFGFQSKATTAKFGYMRIN